MEDIFGYVCDDYHYTYVYDNLWYSVDIWKTFFANESRLLIIYSFFCHWYQFTFDLNLCNIRQSNL